MSIFNTHIFTIHDVLDLNNIFYFIVPLDVQDQLNQFLVAESNGLKICTPATKRFDYIMIT